MGNSNSAKREGTSAAINLNNSFLLCKTELDSCEALCKFDKDFKTFRSRLQAHTHLVIKSLAGGVEVGPKIDKDLKTSNPSLETRPRQSRSIMGEFEVRALSFDSLGKVTGCLSEMNEEASKLILECMEDIRNNPDLLELVEEYVENTSHTLDFCTALEKFLERADQIKLRIKIVLQRFEETDGDEGTRYARTLEALKNFKAAAGDPFTEELIGSFQSFYMQQKETLEKVQRRGKKLEEKILEKKIKHVHAWRKVSSVVFAITYAAALICAIVAKALAIPPVARALATVATTIPFISLGAWIDSQLKKYEDNKKTQGKAYGEVELSTLVNISELDNIRVLIEQFEIEIEVFVHAADLAVNEEAVKIGIVEIKKKLKVFIGNVKD